MNEEYPRVGHFEEALALSVRYAVRGQATDKIRAISIGVDRERQWLHIRAHLDRKPTEDDEELVGVIGTEIISQWVPPDWNIDEDWEVLAPGHEPNTLPGGIAWRRGDPEPPVVKPRE